MRVQYVGIFDEVYVPALNAPIGSLVKRGELVEVDDELGESLLLQPANWAKAAATVRGGKASPSPAGDDTAE